MYKHGFIPATTCKKPRRSGVRLKSGKPVCAGLYDFVMLRYADDVRRMRFSCGCTVSDDMKKKGGDNVI